MFLADFTPAYRLFLAFALELEEPEENAGQVGEASRTCPTSPAPHQSEETDQLLDFTMSPAGSRTDQEGMRDAP